VKEFNHAAGGLARPNRISDCGFSAAADGFGVRRGGQSKIRNSPGAKAIRETQRCLDDSLAWRDDG
jgi:hypothetical protein